MQPFTGLVLDFDRYRGRCPRLLNLSPSGTRNRLLTHPRQRRLNVDGLIQASLTRRGHGVRAFRGLKPTAKVSRRYRGEERYWSCCRL